MLTLEEAKRYLRVDDDSEDYLIEHLIEVACEICLDVARLEDIKAIEKYPYLDIAMLYTVAYLYEHREEADHKELTLSLRALLFGVRQEGF
ncbi:head-tail connector protein [Allofustis seminis]|uniref:head-tail connector protein n=1 Tax=Allofustis seminis TaxID=166939 RepID=UPI0003653E4C|nr:head-tail connector protein [Allofustis seminis]